MDAQVSYRNQRDLWAQTLLNEFSSFYDETHSIYVRLQAQEGQSLQDISAAVRPLRQLSTRLSELSNELFELADADEQLFTAWQEDQKKCRGSEGLLNLEAWHADNFENLSSVALVIGEYAVQADAFLADWQRWQKDRITVPEEGFDPFNEFSLNLRETRSLMRDTFAHVRDLLVKAGVPQ
jgi:hypothetical protein